QLGRILISYQKQGQDVTANVPPIMAPQAPQQPQHQLQQQSIPQPSKPTPSNLGRPNVYSGNTPPPQAPYIPQRSGTGPISVGKPPSPVNSYGKPNPGPYIPQQEGYVSGDSGSRPRVPEYQVTPPPPAIDLVSVVLAIIAFLAVMGLFPLW